MTGFLKFIGVDNYAAAKIGDDFEQEKKSKTVVMLTFTTDFLGAVGLQGADERTLRTHEEEVVRSFIDTTNWGNRKMGAPALG